ncbi:hypothetical protein AAHC03_019130 [Spirometra sp. Aus1]
MTWGFVTCGPNEAMVVSGCCHRRPYYVTGGRLFVLPFIQRLDRISLNIMTLIIESPRIYTQKGVPITVTGVAQVKVQGSNAEMLSTACEQFLGKTEEEIQEVAKETLEGHQRAIMGNMTVEEIYKDRKKFSKAVFEVASSDLINMGISVVSYTLKDIKDDQGYLKALGQARTAQVKRDARIGEAEARRDAGIREAQAEDARIAGQLENEAQVAKAKRDLQLKQAACDKEVQTLKAKSELAYKLQDAAILDMVLQTLPRVAAEVSAPLANCQKVTMVSTGEGEVGISKISNEVMKVVESLPALVSSVTGQDMRSFIPAN